MFLLLGIGFLIAGGVLISEWVGGCTNKCMQFMKVKKEMQQEEHRIEEETKREEEFKRVEAEDIARLALVSASSAIGITFVANAGFMSSPNEDAETQEKAFEVDSGSKGSKHSRRSSVSIAELNSAMLKEMYRGPKERSSNIVMINGIMMSEQEALNYASASKEKDERKQQRGHDAGSEVSKTFNFLNDEMDDEDDENVIEPPKVCRVEINLQAPSPMKNKFEEFLGEKIDN